MEGVVLGLWAGGLGVGVSKCLLSPHLARVLRGGFSFPPPFWESWIQKLAVSQVRPYRKAVAGSRPQESRLTQLLWQHCP